MYHFFLSPLCLCPFMPTLFLVNRHHHPQTRAIPLSSSSPCLFSLSNLYIFHSYAPSSFSALPSPLNSSPRIQPSIFLQFLISTMKESFVVQDAYLFKEETHLTVLKTSLFFAGDGFTVYDSHGQLVFRVDTYGPDARDKDELVLMDPHGLCLLTVRRKRPSLHQRWEGYRGERMDGDKPIFSVKRSSIIGRARASVTVEVYDSDNNGGGGGGEEQLYYQIEGCFSQRNCTVYNATKESVAEIRRKVDQSTSVLLGKEVFTLCVKPGFDGAFAMGLVLVLDQINGDDSVDNGTEPTVHPTTED